MDSHGKIASQAIIKSTAPSKEGSDLDDLFEGFDFDEKLPQKAEISGSNPDIETSHGPLKLDVETKPPGASSINETTPSTAISSPNVNSNSRTSPSSSNSKSVSRRSLLNSLLTPEEESGLKEELNLDISSEIKAIPSRRSVRFTVVEPLLCSRNLSASPEMKDQCAEGNEDSKNASSEFHAASLGRRKLGASWGDFENDFSWLSRSPPGISGSKNNEGERLDSSKSTGILSFDGDLNLNETIVEIKSAAKAEKKSQEDQAMLPAGKENARRSLIPKTSKVRSPSWEPRRINSLALQAIEDGIESSPKERQLQAQLESLRSLLKMAKESHREELRILEQSHLSRIELLEENSRRREKLLQEELEFSVAQCKSQITQMEQFLDANRAEFASNLVAIKNDSIKTITNLRSEHAIELEAVAERHSKAIESLRGADTKEARVLSEMQPTAKALQTLLTQLLSTTNEIKQAEAEHASATAQRLAKLDHREEVLRMAEERLCDRGKEIDKLHLTLTEAISKLEVQLKEQNRSVEDGRWTLKQEQIRLTKLQVILEEDRRALIEQAGKERIELQQLITSFLREFQETQARLAFERNSIMEEQQKFKAEQNNWRSRREEEEKKLHDLKEEVERAKETFQIERHSLDERIHQLRLNEVKLTETQQQLDIIGSNLQNKEIALNERVAQLDRKNEELTNKAALISGNQAVVTEMDAKCRRLAEEQARMECKLQKRRQELDEREVRLVKREETLSRRESELCHKEKTGKKLDCSRCKQAVKKTSRSGCNSNLNCHPADHDMDTPAAKYGSPDYLSRSGPVSRLDTVRLIEDISNPQTRSRMLEQLRTELAEDKKLLENERIFLTALRHTPYT